MKTFLRGLSFSFYEQTFFIRVLNLHGFVFLWNAFYLHVPKYLLVLEMSRRTLRVSKIRDGTVIDHINKGHALNVIKILGINGRSNGVVTIAMNVPSRKLGVKDIVKIEGRELNPEEVNKIALIAPHATINIIRNFKVVEKERVKLPSIIHGIIKCTNPPCISNSESEPVKPIFYVESEEPLRLRCHYCGHVMGKEDVLKQY